MLIAALVILGLIFSLVFAIFVGKFIRQGSDDYYVRPQRWATMNGRFLRNGRTR